MSDSNCENSEPETQLETGPGGSGRKGNGAINTGGPVDGGNDFPRRPRTMIVTLNESDRQVLMELLQPHVTIVGHAVDAENVIATLSAIKPSLIIWEPGEAINSIEICRRVAMALPKSRFLVYTDLYNATKHYNQLSRAGAHGFCLKNSGSRIVLEAVLQLIQVGKYSDPKIVQAVTSPPSTRLPSCDLTDREAAVLLRLELSNEDIARELEMKVRTVEKHVECILSKLKVPTRSAAVLKRM